MKILVIPHAPATTLRTRAYEIARVFANNGHEVDLFRMNEQPDNLSKPDKVLWHLSQLKIKRVPTSTPRLNELFLPQIFRGSNDLRKLIYQLQWKICEMQKYDLVFNSGYWGVQPKNCRKLIYDVVDDHSDGANNPENTLRKGVINYMQDQIQSANKIIASSKVLVDLISKKHDVDVSLFPNGARVEEIRSKSQNTETKKLRIGYVGGLDLWVNIKMLLEAVQILRDKGIEAELSIAGRGSAMDGLELPSHCHFAGFLSPEQIPNFIGEFQVGVVPFDISDITNAALPLKVLEYGAAKKTVVSTALKELQLQKFPWVELTEDNAQSFAGGLEKSLNTSWNNEWDSIIDGFSWDSIGEGILEEATKI